MKPTLLSAIFASLLLACGGSTTSATTPDGGTSSDASTSQADADASQVDAGCPEPAPANLVCPGCGNGGEAPICQAGQWTCPPPPPCPEQPVDSGVDDSSTRDASANDGGFACAACNPETNYCELQYPPPPHDGGAGVPTDTCLPLPACDAAPSCACISYGPFCTCADDAGEITVTCPFHV